MTNNTTVISFRDRVAQAAQCDVSEADILCGRELELVNLAWHDESMDAEMQARLIKHERAMEKFAKKAA